MKRFKIFAAVFLLAAEARGQEGQGCEGGVCVPKEDLRAFVQLAREAKCRNETPPQFVADPVTIVIDREGRVYGSGADPQPYKVKLHWCNDDLEAKGQVKLIAAQREEPTSGFRFRGKATVGYLPVSAYNAKNGYAGLDAGVLLEPFFFSWANINAYVGARAVGAGVGFDLTRNMGAYLGYAVTWGTWQHNSHAGLSFALW